jgi:hypothetical protein
MALLPFVCQTEVRTCHSMSPKSRAVCCGYQFVYRLIYHLQPNAEDLPGRSKLPGQRRDRVSNDVFLPGKAAINRLLTWSVPAS